MATERKTPSSYRYYKLEDLAAICGVHKIDIPNLLAPIQPLVVSDWLQSTLDRHLLMPMLNEKAKSELLVVPILVEMATINQNFKPLSGITFTLDKERGLHGVCDFIISNNPYVSGLESPIVCVFEAKDDKLESWYGQCGAEMYAAKLFNAQKGNNISIIHGAVTNGFTWQFLKLEGQTLFVDSQRYGTANLPQLLGAIQKVYDFYK
jgi:hypothetical protein